jgi:hypothetical protein
VQARCYTDKVNDGSADFWWPERVIAFYAGQQLTLDNERFWPQQC